MPFEALVFGLGALVSLATSWVLVTRLERIGARVGLSEALLGMVAALAADGPEITSSIAAVLQHQRAVGAGVVIGSNVFNLAALLGLGAVVSGYISLHRKVVVLGGVVAVWIGAWCVAASVGLVSAVTALVMAGLVLAGYVAVLGMRRENGDSPGRGRRWRALLSQAIVEEELELKTAIDPPQAAARDVVEALATFVIVVVSSVVMERSGTELGHQLHFSAAIIGAIVLAAVTSLPNAVAAVHLASKGRGAAALSTALNSNNLNVVVGLLVPGALLGLARPSFSSTFVATSYVTLTFVVLALAYWKRGLTRRGGLFIVALYVGFVAVLVATSSR